MAFRAARFALLLAPALSLGASALAQEATPPPAAPVPDVVLEYDVDRADRMTVPVIVDGRGPFNFVVDTGAERTAIARELATDLALGAGRPARVHSMSEVSDIQTVVIPNLEVGGKRVAGIQAPALARRHLGAEGMLGVDSLRSQRVSFDFVRKSMTITPARRQEERWANGSIVVTGRRIFGRLVLVDAAVDGQKVWVIIDTGSEVTVGNSALRRKLEGKGRLGPTHPIEAMSITGGRILAERGTTRRIRLGDMDINNMPIAFADVHPFKKLDLMDRPALLLGMDVLRLLDRVSVDFANRKVRMLARPQSSLAERAQLARLER
jgi:predicted aspartyl protease